MPSPTDPIRSLTDGRFRFQMALRPGDGVAFFAPTPHHADVMAERRALLDSSPASYIATTPGTAPLLNDAARLVHSWLESTEAPPPPLPVLAPDAEPAAMAAWCVQAGRTWEPDWVVLRRGEDASYRLVAGTVCFPSGWALADKHGCPLLEIHHSVPGLNQVLGSRIQTFLDRLQPGAVWARDNWGLSADSALNHHPDLHLRPLAADTPLTATWLRYEEQLLARLPSSPNVLFGIRVGRIRLAHILPFPEVTRRLTEALLTMPEDVAAYKGIAPARASLLRQLQAVTG